MTAVRKLDVGGRFVLSGPHCRALGSVRDGVERLEAADGLCVLEDLRLEGVGGVAGRARAALVECGLEAGGDPGAAARHTDPRSRGGGADAGHGAAAAASEPRSFETPPPFPELLRAFLPPAAPALVVEWAFSTPPTAPARVSWRVPDATRVRAVGPVLAARLPAGQVARFHLDGAAAWSFDPARRRVEVVAGWPESGPLRLVAGAAPAGRAARRQAARSLRFVDAQRVRAAAPPGDPDALTVDTPGSAVGEAVAWAAARLPLDGAAEGDAHSLTLQGLGAVALGRWEAAGACLKGALASLAPALYRWRGDLSSREGGDPTFTLEGFLEPTGSLVPLRRAGAEAPTEAPGPWPWAEAWHAFDRGQAARGGEALEALAQEGMAGAPGVWPGRARWPDSAVAALVPATVVFGLLGASADGFYGRLRLAPRLPDHWVQMQVRGLRVGDARVELDYRRDGAAHTFRLRQTRGAVPLMVVFEPAVPHQAIDRVEVDGQAAELDRVPLPEGAGTRLQLPLDRERKVTLVGSD